MISTLSMPPEKTLAFFSKALVYSVSFVGQYFNSLDHSNRVLAKNWEPPATKMTNTIVVCFVNNKQLIFTFPYTNKLNIKISFNLFMHYYAL